jgi:hypothetical protein
MLILPEKESRDTAESAKCSMEQIELLVESKPQTPSTVQRSHLLVSWNILFLLAFPHQLSAIELRCARTNIVLLLDKLRCQFFLEIRIKSDLISLED